MNVLILTNKEHENFVFEQAEQYAKDHLLFVIYSKNDAETIWKSYSYDVGISFMYPYRVPKEQIEHRPWINFHPGPLPEYKGRNLCYHAIMNGEKEFGATVHYMDENFDTGDIIYCLKFLITASDTAESLSAFTIETSKRLFSLYLPRILSGEVFQTTKNVGGTYYKKANIAEVVSLDKDVPLSRFIRAVYYPPYYPKFEIGGVTYKIVKDE
jgi:methionyl-tRNA formyltransferase